MLDEVDRSRDGAALADVLGDWSTGPGPLYRKLATALRRAVDEGALLPGERLLSERHLSRTLAVSRATVVAAYDELRAGGVLESRRGSGTHVTARARPPVDDGRVRGGRGTAIFQRLIDGPGPLISLTCAAEGGIPELAEVVQEVARHDLPDLLAEHGYHPRGLPALRIAIADYYTAAGLPTCADEVLVTTGAHQALVLVADLYIRVRTTVLVESPSWPGCFDVFHAAGARLSGVPMDDEGIEVRALGAALAGQAPSLLCVMPTYHNPTGILMSPARRRQVAALAARHCVPVVEDNAYTGLEPLDGVGGVPAPVAAYAPEGAEVLTVSSLSKAVWTGLRIGWVRAPGEIVERLARRKALADLGSPLLDQAVAARLMSRVADLTVRCSASLRERLDLLERLLREQLPSWRWRRPDGGSSLWVELPGADAAVYAQVALRHGVEVVPGAAVDPEGTHDNYLRMPLTFPPDTLVELVRRLARAWAELQRHGPCDDAPLHPIV
ncbi:MAG: aminotransferase class I/II-fold pyridoxal phosphate-dependent enzyme [Streptosporangiales bacterium]|nr:aminotransferase class I/II-fold pyridoxal phosphate-dependent enzyme [Streptosporangiales bacterium]